MIWSGWVLWHINHCWLFNAKSSIYIYIKYIQFVNILLIIFSNEPMLILLHTVKWFQILLCITNSSIKHRSFVYKQLHDQTVLFQTIQFSMSFVCTQIKYQTVMFDLIRCYQFRPEWTWEQWQWRSTLNSPKLQHCFSLTIRLFNVISTTLVRGILPLCRDAVGIFYSPIWLRHWFLCLMVYQPWRTVVGVLNLLLGGYGVHAFPKSIFLKGYIIVSQEFKFACSLQCFNWVCLLQYNGVFPNSSEKFRS